MKGGSGGHLVLLTAVEMKCRLYILSWLELLRNHSVRRMSPTAGTTNPPFKTLFLVS
jgi:hypothetical protein